MIEAKEAGWALAALADLIATIGCVGLWISLSGPIFGLSRRTRIWLVVSPLGCGGLAFWIINQLAAPLLR